MNESETAPESSAPAEATPVITHHQRWRTGDVVAMGLAAALVVGAAGTGLYAAVNAIESQAAAAEQTTQTDTTSASQDSTDQVYGGQVYGGQTGGYGSGQSGTGQSGTAQSGTTTLDTTAATADQSVGVVVIDTVLGYESAEAAGTGLILTADGRILTNNHVVEGATSITVTVVATGAEYTAEVVGTNATEDIAVLELVNASGLTVANLDTSGQVGVGDAVTGVGNAGGTGTLTAAAGAVLSLEQSITAQDSDGSNAEALTGLIEVDADIQSGESGGPLYDADGEVVGINTAASSGSTNITGYAIPIEDALQIVDAIDAAVADGSNTDTITVGYPAFLGIGLGSATAQGTSTGTSPGAATGTSSGTRPGVSTESSTTGAATVAGVIADTPAATIGLAAGDTITAVNGTAVATATALSAALAGHHPGDTVTVDWVDAAGAAHSAEATLIAGPAA